jgi:acetoin utilization deacetylase AcuC-like enzyme
MVNSPVGYVFSPDLILYSDLLPSSNQRAKLTHSLICAYQISNLNLIKSERASEVDLTAFHSKEYIRNRKLTQNVLNQMKLKLIWTNLV